MLDSLSFRAKISVHILPVDQRRFIQSSVADPERFDVDPDSKFCQLGREFFFKSSLFLLHNLTELVMCNFLSNNAGGGAKGEG